MNNRNLIIAILVISIFGLAFIQYQYLRIGLNLAKVQFNEKVEEAMVDIKNGLRTENELTFLLASAMQRDTSYFRTSPDSVLDASSYFLNDFLNESLVQHGIEADFAYSLMTRDSAYYLKSPKSADEKDRSEEFPILLEGYLPKSFQQRFVLNLKFRDLNRYFLSQLNGLTFPSILFLIGILGVIVWALRTYYWQRKVITTTDAFINNLTHELKTPVFSISLASKMLKGKVDDSSKTFVDIVRQQSERLTNHIDKVLELATMERKKSIMELKPIDFFPFLEKVCLDFEVLTALEPVDFTYDLMHKTFPISGESFHLQNVVNNLLDNAKKYSSNPKIELKAWKGDKDLIITVKDNGVGIPKTEQKKVFEKYYRGNTGNTHDVKGFGLGLNYVKTVVKQHHGKIELDSELKKGTTVTLRIPRYESK
ncbi:MAG: HAMP domain-containing sensor histidine kinase [Bacteroidota bacterium]